MDSAGQSAMEMVIAIAFIMMIFIILLFSYQLKLIESNELKMVMDGKRICRSVSTNINTIAEQGPSYYLYFNIPQKIQGGHEYNITVSKNFVDIAWYQFSWTEQIITTNVTVHCLDKGLDVKNKVLNDNDRVLILCNRPELTPLPDSFEPITAVANETLNVSIDVENFGVTDAGSFTVRVNDTNVAVSGLGRDEKTTVMAELTMPPSPEDYRVRISVDYNDEINESIESNNVYNATIQVQ
ncbi:MAG: hypothetical protein L6243_00935 [Candidatus Altiarchaeales archaeon]|nr:hypothetical protein [Candidatus Altiarchaeota archaeon]MBU4341131.1 hypothetical protein [Candidatus Altiarchaeota archaeon]MBU4437893.1 hypothetical protein [Candidatus Altiarchaeota archaeon]MCG2782135.1 hypothetical protein [Candidatus Altiarchaeales archaeon]